jgi:DNA-binding MarR family transcriptional regulator
MKTRTTDARPTLASDALTSLLVAAGRVTRELEAACQTQGITHDQFNVLRILRAAAPAGHSRGELSQRLTSRAPDVTRMLDRLERRGLVSRSSTPDNRRLSIARITDEGSSVLAHLEPAIERIQSAFTVSYSWADMRELKRLATALAVRR